MQRVTELQAKLDELSRRVDRLTAQTPAPIPAPALRPGNRQGRLNWNGREFGSIEEMVRELEKEGVPEEQIDRILRWFREPTGRQGG